MKIGRRTSQGTWTKEGEIGSIPKWYVGRHEERMERNVDAGLRKLRKPIQIYPSMRGKFELIEGPVKQSLSSRQWGVIAGLWIGE